MLLPGLLPPRSCPAWMMRNGCVARKEEEGWQEGAVGVRALEVLEERLEALPLRHQASLPALGAPRRFSPSFHRGEQF